MREEVHFFWENDIMKKYRNNNGLCKYLKTKTIKKKEPCNHSLEENTDLKL